MATTQENSKRARIEEEDSETESKARLLLSDRFNANLAQVPIRNCDANRNGKTGRRASFCDHDTVTVLGLLYHKHCIIRRYVAGRVVDL